MKGKVAKKVLKTLKEDLDTFIQQSSDLRGTAWEARRREAAYVYGQIEYLTRKFELEEEQ